MAKDIQSSVRRIERAKTDIVSAIETKGVSVPDGAKIDDMPELISHIEIGTDTSDATATASDIAGGKTAYVDGQKVIGEINTLMSAGATPAFVNGNIRMPYSGNDKMLLKKDSFFFASADEFGDAAAENVAKGKTFTSSAGLAVVGTHECPAPKLHEKQITPSAAAKTYYPNDGYDGISKVSVVGDPELSPENVVYGKQIFDVVGSHKCPTFTTQEKTVTPSAQAQTVKPDSGYDGLSSVAVSGDSNLTPANIKKDVSVFGVTGALDPQGGIDTSDATATASDIAYGKTAYVNGEKVNGEINTLAAAGTVPTFSNGKICMSYNGTGRSLVDKNSVFSASADKFGDAAAENVAKGKTFTSAAGLNVVGTMETDGGGSVGDYKTTTITLDADVDKVELLGPDVNATEILIVFNGQCTDKSRAIFFSGLFNATGKNDSINATTNRDVVVYLKKLNDSVGIQFIKADGYPANTVGTANMSRCSYNKNKALGSFVQSSGRFKAGSKFEVLYR